MPPQVRNLMSILAATGMRLDEAALLNWEDVKCDQSQGVTYFDLTSSLVKNRGSQRKIPVHPALDWITVGRRGQMFPEFPRDRDSKTQSASSKALMPFIRQVTQVRQKAVVSTCQRLSLGNAIDERLVRLGRQLYRDRIVFTDLPSAKDNAHDSGFARHTCWCHLFAVRQ